VPFFEIANLRNLAADIDKNCNFAQQNILYEDKGLMASLLPRRTLHDLDGRRSVPCAYLQFPLHLSAMAAFRLLPHRQPYRQAAELVVGTAVPSSRLVPWQCFRDALHP